MDFSRLEYLRDGNISEMEYLREGKREARPTLGGTRTPPSPGRRADAGFPALQTRGNNRLSARAMRPWVRWSPPGGGAGGETRRLPVRREGPGEPGHQGRSEGTRRPLPEARPAGGSVSAEACTGHRGTDGGLAAGGAGVCSPCRLIPRSLCPSPGSRSAPDHRRQGAPLRRGVGWPMNPPTATLHVPGAHLDCLAACHRTSPKRARCAKPEVCLPPGHSPGPHAVLAARTGSAHTCRPDP